MPAMLAYTRFEVLRTLRNPRFLVLTMLMPAMLFAFFHEVRTGFSPSLMVAMAGFSMIMATTSANTVTLPAERASGWLRQLRITPLTGAGWVTARIVLSTVVILPGLAVVALCGALLGNVQMSAVQWLAFVLLVLAASVPFSFLGLLLGQLLDTQSAQPVQGLLTMLLSFGGGIFIPLTAFPSFMQTLGGALPTHQLVQGGQDVMANRLPALTDVAGLGAWALALAAAALLVWSRQAESRVALG
jgi:ABC-2 type transport system permease protein